MAKTKTSILKKTLVAQALLEAIPNSSPAGEREKSAISVMVQPI